MSKNDAVKQDEATGENQAPQTEVAETTGENQAPQTEVAETSANQCPDCEGRGIRNPDIDHHVCLTCDGTGKA